MSASAQALPLPWSRPSPHLRTGAIARPRAALLLSLGAALLLALLALAFSARYHHNVVDDALISLRYAENLASGRGLVFNPGERVEGYTNFLWIALLAAVRVVTRPFEVDFVRAASVTSILVAALGVVLLGELGRRLWRRPLLPLAAMLGLVVADDAYVVWAMQALEKHLVVLFVVLALLARVSMLEARGPLLGICLAAAVMARPDAGLLAVAFGASELVGLATAALMRGLRPARLPEPAAWRARELGAATAAFVVLVGAWSAWRLGYYGSLLPNTYHAKLASPGFDGWQRGVDYARSFFAEREWIPLAAMPAVFWARHPVIRALWLWTLLHVAWVTWIGGDFYPGHRFFVVLVPALALLAAHALFGLCEACRRVAVRSRARAAWRALPSWAGLLIATPAVTTTALAGVEQGPLRTEIDRWRDHIERNRRYMLWLKSVAPPGASIMTGDIGSAGLWADLSVVDYYGIVDPDVARRPVRSLGRGKAGHEKVASLEHVMARRPTFIKLGYLPGDFTRFGYHLDDSMPRELGFGAIWRLDELAERGEYLPDAALDFDPGRYDGWAAEGPAFASWPVRGAGRGQRGPVGADGWYLSSWHPDLGDRATGRLVSAPFRIVGDVMVLSVGGGHDPRRLTVSLLMDGRRVRRATGSGSERLCRRIWNVRELRGRHAQLELVDEATGAWGHLMLDQVRQWRGSAPD